MKITFDPAKRDATLEERGLDFAEAEAVFKGPTQTFEDNRRDYPEIRFITFGFLMERMVVVVWTPQAGDTRRIISMRKANGREQRRFGQQPG